MAQANRIGRVLGLSLAHPDAGVAVASPAATNGNGKHAGTPEQKGVILRPAVDFVGPDTAHITYIAGGASSEVEQVSRQTALTASAYAYRAISYRAAKTSEAPLYVIQEEPDGEEETTLFDHPLAELIAEPSPDIDMVEMLYLTRVYRDVTGAALWVKNPNQAGRTGMLTVFDGDSFDVRPDTVDGTRRMYGRFTVKTLDGEQRTYGPDEVVYFREPGGVSPLHVALGMLNMGQRAQATVKAILANALFPSVVVQAHPEWAPEPDEFERWQHNLSRYARPENKGKPLGLTGGGSATVVSMNLKDLMPGDVLDRVEATVASVFGIPAVVLSFLVGLKHSPWSQMAEARRMAYEDTLLPLMSADERVLTRQLLRPVDENPRRKVVFDTAQIPALQADRKVQSEIAEKVADIGSVDERRALMGWDPHEDEDFGRSVTGRAAASPSGGIVEQGESTDAAKHAVRPPEAKATSDTFRKASRLFRFDLLTKAQESTWEASIARQLSEDRSAVLSAFDRGMKEAKAPPYGADPDKVRALVESLAAKLSLDAWERRVTPLVEGTAKAAERQLYAELGVGFDVEIPGLEEYVQREAAWLVTQVTDTTKQAIRDALEQGLKDGESIDALRKRLEEGGMFSRSRAELIARTESTRVTNGAQVEAAKNLGSELGARVTKTWLATKDARVRDSHLSMDGTTVGIDENFPNGRSAPGEPNCRCSLIYSLEDRA